MDPRSAQLNINTEAFEDRDQMSLRNTTFTANGDFHRTLSNS